MSPTEMLHRQSELEERRLGMRTLDPAEITRHFGRAAELRALIATERPQLVVGPTGTKGAYPSEPK